MVFDGRNMYDPAVMREGGIEYFGSAGSGRQAVPGLIRLRQPGQPRARNRIALCALADLEQRTLQSGRRPPCRVVARHVGSRLLLRWRLVMASMAPAVRLQ